MMRVAYEVDVAASSCVRLGNLRRETVESYELAGQGIYSLALRHGSVMSWDGDLVVFHSGSA